MTVHRPFDFSVGPTLAFPVREDIAVPIQHPTLASLERPGELIFQIRVKNWYDHEQVVTLTARDENLTLTPARTQIVLPANAKQKVEIHAAPNGGSGAYPLAINLRSGHYDTKEEAMIAAWRKGEALAHQLDYDHDGFPDVILENSLVRLFVSPYDGGRAFAFVSKTTGANAFNSVGGMRDSFTKRVDPEDLRDLPEWTRAAWLGLFNRPYAFRILSAAGTKVAVHLEYTAPDIYPEGVRLERELILSGNSNYYLVETSLTPGGVAEPQSYALENSVTFKLFNEPENFRQWFAEDRTPERFIPDRNVDLPSASRFIGTTNKRTGESFAVLSLSPLAKSQLAAHPHAATLRLIYPEFAEKNRRYTFRTAYFFGKANPEEIQVLCNKLARAKD